MNGVLLIARNPIIIGATTLPDKEFTVGVEAEPRLGPPKPPKRGGASHPRGPALRLSKKFICIK